MILFLMGIFAQEILICFDLCLKPFEDIRFINPLSVLSAIISGLYLNNLWSKLPQRLNEDNSVSGFLLFSIKIASGFSSIICL